MKNYAIHTVDTAPEVAHETLDEVAKGYGFILAPLDKAFSDVP